VPPRVSAPILDSGAGFLLSSGRKSRTSRGAADVLSGVLEKQTPIGCVGHHIKDQS
jgi:hypothetical protein